MNTDDIVEMALSDQFNDVEIDMYMSVKAQAEAWREVIAVYAVYKDDKALTYDENRSERLSQIGEFFEQTLTSHIENKNARVAA
tara:strand:+ start:5175 stop:5426 length:252 start_codon:yes stop_codon:yes gene_type:complete